MPGRGGLLLATSASNLSFSYQLFSRRVALLNGFGLSA